MISLILTNTFPKKKVAENKIKLINRYNVSEDINHKFNPSFYSICMSGNKDTIKI